MAKTAALYDPLAAGRSLERQQANLVSTKSYQMTSRTPGKMLDEDTGNAQETGHPSPRYLLFFSPCVPHLEKELTAPQHLLPDCAQMRAHICRTRGPAPMILGKLDEEASNRDASRDEFVQSRDGKLTRQRAGKSSPNRAPGRSDDGKPQDRFLNKKQRSCSHTPTEGQAAVASAINFERRGQRLRSCTVRKSETARKSSPNLGTM